MDVQAPLRVLMVSDFFAPNVGGVETHVYQLAVRMVERGHEVVVLTHAYNGRVGVRYITDWIKVYYVPRKPVWMQATAPTFFGSARIVRCVILRERITLLHAHQAFSSLAHESILLATTMRLPVVFTDHSLFGFSETSSILTNKLLKFSLAVVGATICVSHTSKENTVLRACLPPSRVFVIPNAVDYSAFTPAQHKIASKHITIVLLSRLVYRKGMDLLAKAIPVICQKHSNVRFIIGGDGPRRPQLEDMVDRHNLNERVKFLGMVPHIEVRDVLVQGDIFLNASLTEAFCIALVEAAACGLLVVSTKVGGVPEVLPPDMMLLAAPNVYSIVEAVSNAIKNLPTVNRWDYHERVKAMYNWRDVAQRTEVVYGSAVKQCERHACECPEHDLLYRLQRYHRCGKVAGKLFCFVAILMHLYVQLLEWMEPSTGIDSAVWHPRQKQTSASAFAQLLEEIKATT